MTTPPVPEPLDPARALDATRASVARDGSIYLPIAGAFVLLPQLATMLLGPQMPASTDAMMKLLTTAPWPLLLSLLVPAFIGLIADLTISRMVIDAADGRATPPRSLSQRSPTSTSPRPIRPMPGATFRHGRSSATRTCTPRCRLTRACSELG